jgi:hypothetical protein
MGETGQSLFSQLDETLSQLCKTLLADFQSDYRDTYPTVQVELVRSEYGTQNECHSGFAKISVDSETSLMSRTFSHLLFYRLGGLLRGAVVGGGAQSSRDNADWLGAHVGKKNSTTASSHANGKIGFPVELSTLDIKVTWLADMITVVRPRLLDSGVSCSHLLADAGCPSYEKRGTERGALPLLTARRLTTRLLVNLVTASLDFSLLTVKCVAARERTPVRCSISWFTSFGSLQKNPTTTCEHPPHLDWALLMKLIPLMSVRGCCTLTPTWERERERLLLHGFCRRGTSHVSCKRR